MRAGRLPEILCNEDIIVVGASGSKALTKKYRSEWKLMDFAHKFPFTEVVKISPLSEDKLMVYVYDSTAKALAEKRYEDVLKYAEAFETHTFNDDIGYIESCSCGKAEKVELEQRNLIEMLNSTPSNMLKSLKAVIMREDEKSNEWNVWLCKTDVKIDIGAACNINDMKIADVLAILAKYKIKTEIRYDYFYWDCYQ